jgi:nucleotide-binding universal stress UspA family protein
MSQPLRTILVAVDFGEASTRALAAATTLAVATGATLRVLHAETLDAPPYFTRAQIDSLEAEAQATRTRAIEFLRAFVQPHVSVPVEVEIDARVPTDAILRASVGTDLVVMGTHGRRGPSRWWLGSVAERVLRETTVPLLVVHAGSAVAKSAFREGMLLLPAMDAQVTRTRALATALAKACGGSVFALTSADPRAARAESGATWVAVPAPTPRSGRWLAQVGEPLVSGCLMPVLFVPEEKETL